MNLVVNGFSTQHKTTLTSSNILFLQVLSLDLLPVALSSPEDRTFNIYFFHITFCRCVNTKMLWGDILLTSLLIFGPQLRRLLVFDILHAKSCHLDMLSLCHPLEQQ